MVNVVVTVLVDAVVVPAAVVSTAEAASVVGCAVVASAAVVNTAEVAGVVGCAVVAPAGVVSIAVVGCAFVVPAAVAEGGGAALRADGHVHGRGGGGDLVVF